MMRAGNSVRQTPLPAKIWLGVLGQTLRAELQPCRTAAASVIAQGKQQALQRRSLQGHHRKAWQGNAGVRNEYIDRVHLKIHVEGRRPHSAAEAEHAAEWPSGDAVRKREPMHPAGEQLIGLGFDENGPSVRSHVMVSLADGDRRAVLGGRQRSFSRIGALRRCEIGK
jgi:hypothetical protein